MTARRSVDLDVPPLGRPRPAEQPSSPRLRRFPIVIGPEAVYLMAQRQREAAKAKAVARHKRRRGQRK